MLCLANKSNLKRWKKSDTDTCALCGKIQLHVPSNCSVSANEKRYTWRHKSVLKTVSTYIMQLHQHCFTLYIDFDGYASPGQLFNGYRPDVAIFKGRKITVVELTICFEMNVIKSREYKKNKYSRMNKNVTVKAQVFCENYSLILRRRDAQGRYPVIFVLSGTHICFVSKECVSG